MVNQRRGGQKFALPTYLREAKNPQPGWFVVAHIFGSVGKIQRECVALPAHERLGQCLCDVFTSTVFPDDKAEAGFPLLGGEHDFPSPWQDIRGASFIGKVPTFGAFARARSTFK